MEGKKLKAVGSRSEVMHGNAKHTSGGLKKSQLAYNKRGKIVSRKASNAARARFVRGWTKKSCEGLGAHLKRKGPSKLGLGLPKRVSRKSNLSSKPHKK